MRRGRSVAKHSTLASCVSLACFFTVDLEDYTNKFITGAPISRERSRQRQESLTAKELSVLRGVRGAASWRAQQMSPQFAADVSLLLGATARPVVQDLQDANKLVRDMRRSAARSLLQ